MSQSTFEIITEKFYIPRDYLHTINRRSALLGKSFDLTTADDRLRDHFNFIFQSIPSSAYDFGASITFHVDQQATLIFVLGLTGAEFSIISARLRPVCDLIASPLLIPTILLDCLADHIARKVDACHRGINNVKYMIGMHDTPSIPSNGLGRQSAGHWEMDTITASRDLTRIAAKLDKSAYACSGYLSIISSFADLQQNYVKHFSSAITPHIWYCEKLLVKKGKV